MNVSRNLASSRRQKNEGSGRGLSLRNLTSHAIPSRTPRNPVRGVPFLALKDAVLGKTYELSLVFTTPRHSRLLNRTYRGNDKPANILSFPLSKTSGEIFIDLATARREAPAFDRMYTNFIAFLFIHGLFHLKGFKHSAIMERNERAIRKQFEI
ncbi:MAG: rRNA maturation RNase YbeY [Minisyncoccota bacterium]